jgi:hypothetical protein
MFRNALVEQLAAIADSQEKGERLAGMEYVEEKQDVLSELLDYYTDELIKYKPFAEEFNSVEIEELRRVLDFLRIASEGKATWSQVKFQATNLWKCLAGSETWTIQKDRE